MKPILFAILLACSSSFAATTVGNCSLYAGAGTGAVLATGATQADCVASADKMPDGPYTIKTPATVVSVTGTVSLAVAGAPNLPYTGTSTAVAVLFTSGTPTKVELSRDGLPVFATWTPTVPGPFFTPAADGRSISGNWCLLPSCWGGNPAQVDHTLTAKATYADGKTASSTVALKVQDATPPPPPPPPTGGMTAAMWADWAQQRTKFGDPNDCKARVDAIPTTGFALAPGGNIASALASNNVVLLQTGVYPVTARFGVPPGKVLAAAPGQKPVIDLKTATDWWVIGVGNNATFAGIEVRNSPGWGITTFNLPGGTYANGGLIYQVVVHDNGMDSRAADNGTGIVVTGGAKNWCVVDAEVYNTFDKGGGGNSDGVASNFSASQTSFINVNSHNSGDDGIDMWQGGQSYHYFGNYHDNGKVPGKPATGDGNGVKLGTGSVSHKFYKSTATNNRTGGFNLNGNTQQPILVQSTASGNPSGDYMNGVNAP